MLVAAPRYPRLVNDDAAESIRWTDFSIVCPHCGNRGEEGGEWEVNAWSPFKLIEEVIRSWMFVPNRQEDGSVILVADTGSDEVDWESGTNLRFECMQCFGDFAVPEGIKVDFDST